MSTLSFLVGLPTSDAVYTSEGTEDIAYANDWVPLGWLALFETGDVRMVSGAESEDQTPCPTLLTRKDRALSNFRHRLTIGAMDTTLANRWSGPLSFVQATVGKNLREIRFPYPDLVRAAIAGHE
jgi:hypothetical protein